MTVLKVSQDSLQSQLAPPVQDLAVCWNFLSFLSPLLSHLTFGNTLSAAHPGWLKQRVGTTAASSQLFPDLQATVYVGGDEPPLKKFKALLTRVAKDAELIKPTKKYLKLVMVASLQHNWLQSGRRKKRKSSPTIGHRHRNEKRMQ